MANKKRQHYVPQFYLRNFSWGEGRLPIKLFNIRRKQLVTAGNLKGQCYEDYMYGKDLMIENAFGMIEGRMSKIVEKILQTGQAPIRNSTDHDALLTFVLLQYGRTKYAGEAADEQVEKLAKALLAKQPNISPEELAKVKIGLKNPFSMTLRAIGQSLPVAHDLRIKVAVNRTPIRFITSDHPVVFYNQYAEHRTIRSNTGLASKGLQIFYPISPYHIIILYDEAIYKIGAKKSTSVDVTSVSDVQQLNDLQWLNALENLYFDNTQPLTEIDRGAKCNIARRSVEKAIFSESEAVPLGEGKFSSTIMMVRPEPKIALRLQFLKSLKEMSDEEKHYPGVLLRDPARSEAHNLFLKAVDDGQYKVSEFGKFASDQYAAATRVAPYGTAYL